MPARIARTIALLLLLLQAMVVPAHRHDDSRPTVAATSVAAAPERHRPALPADCPVCREVAHAGPLLTPGQVHLPSPSATHALAAVVTSMALRGAERSHSWRSRAPPVVGLS